LLGCYIAYSLLAQRAVVSCFALAVYSLSHGGLLSIPAHFRLDGIFSFSFCVTTNCVKGFFTDPNATAICHREKFKIWK
jgi:hypothetical protein